MAQLQMGRGIRSAPQRRSTDVAERDPDSIRTDTWVVAPGDEEPCAYELFLQSIAYESVVTAFYYESVDLLPMLTSWLQLHACTHIARDGPYVSFRQVRDAALVESRVEVGGYCLLVPSGPLKGSVQPGKAEEVARLYRLIGRTKFTGQRIDDPEQLLLQATDASIQRVLQRLIAAEGLLIRIGHEEWCEQVNEDPDSCSCGHNNLVAAWCEVSGAGPARLVSCWQRSSTAPS